MKYFTSIPAVLLVLTSVNALAAPYTCKPITGTIQQLSPDPACNILKDKNNYFPDATFFGTANSCFSGNLQATLDGKSVTGTSYSGLTANGVGQFTAASIIRLKSGPIELGRVFTKDVVLLDPDNNPIELVTMVGGSKMFKGGYGNLEIKGNGLYQATSFSGLVCIEN